MTAQEFRQELERRKGGKKQVESDLAAAELELGQTHLKATYAEEAQTIIQNVAQATQSNLEYHISELGTLALASVFSDAFKLKIDFVLRRNQSEADIWFVHGEYKVPPKSLGCGGEIELASFALRPSILSLIPTSKKPSNVLFLDEPLHSLKGGELPVLGAAVIKEVSDKMKLQIIMVSHQVEQITSADKRINLSIKNQASQIKIT